MFVILNAMFWKDSLLEFVILNAMFWKDSLLEFVMVVAGNLSLYRRYWTTQQHKNKKTLVSDNSSPEVFIDPWAASSRRTLYCASEL